MKIGLQLVLMILFAGHLATAQTAVKSTYPGGRADSSEWAGLMSLYPSPAKTYVNLHVEWQASQTFKVSLYDSASELLKEWSATRKVYEYSIDVSQLPVGNYSIIVTTSAGVRLKGDFVVMR